MSEIHGPPNPPCKTCEGSGEIFNFDAHEYVECPDCEGDGSEFDGTGKATVDCPRCFTQCGWCADYRHMHGPDGGTLRLPEHRQKTEILSHEE